MTIRCGATVHPQSDLLRGILAQQFRFQLFMQYGGVWPIVTGKLIENAVHRVLKVYNLQFSSIGSFLLVHGEFINLVHIHWPPLRDLHLKIVVPVVCATHLTLFTCFFCTNIFSLKFVRFRFHIISLFVSQ